MLNQFEKELKKSLKEKEYRLNKFAEIMEEALNIKLVFNL